VFNLSYGDVLVILGGAVGVGYGAVKYGVSQSLKAVEGIRKADMKAADDKANTLASTVKEQHQKINDSVQTLSGKVEDLTIEVKEKFGELKGLDIDNRLNRHDERLSNLEQSNKGVGEYVARVKHRRR